MTFAGKFISLKRTFQQNNMYDRGIVVAPTFFDVPPETKETYGEQNPGMGLFGRPDRTKTRQEWLAMTTALQNRLDIYPHRIDPDPELFDMVFACDPGFWITNRDWNVFIAANFSVPRQAEVEHFARWMRLRQMADVHELPPDAKFEAGDCVFVMNGREPILILFWGETRTNALGVEEVKKILEPLGVKVLPIRRVTKEFYHGNSVATIYQSANLFTFYAPAFDLQGPRMLLKTLGHIEVASLPEKWLFGHDEDLGGEYLYLFGLNQIENNGRSLTAHCHYEYGDFLVRRGITPIVVPTPELKRSRGSHRCSVNLQNLAIAR